MSNLCASPAKPECHRKSSVIKKFHSIAAIGAAYRLKMNGNEIVTQVVPSKCHDFRRPYLQTVLSHNIPATGVQIPSKT